MISYTTKQVANRVTIFRCEKRQTETVGYEFAHMIYLVSMNPNVKVKR